MKAQQPPAPQFPAGQTINKEQLGVLVKGLMALFATAEQKVHGLELMITGLQEEPDRLRWEEMFGERFTTGLRNYLDATRATEELAYQGVQAQLKHYQEALKRMESGIVLPTGFTIGQ
jgi:hypothetical protein